MKMILNDIPFRTNSVHTLHVYSITAYHSAAAAVPVITEGSSVPPGQRGQR